MRRAVKDYRYEVGESRMDEECAQYLTQLQKDWERQRVKIGGRKSAKGGQVHPKLSLRAALTCNSAHG